MANFKKNILTLLVFLTLQSPLFAQGNIPSANVKDYGAIYDNLEEADFDYIFGIDPYQADEYTKFMRSPYPLFRSGVALIFKSKRIPPGYYLLTPREKNDKTWILFKENGRVQFVIPVYKEETVPEKFYEQKFPQAIPTKTQKTRQKVLDFIGTHWGKANQRTPVPQTFLEFNDEGLYWDMILYYGDKKYSLIFLKEQ